MAHEWIVDVRSDGKPVTDASVAVVPNSALAGLDWPFATVKSTHAHRDKGRYREKKPITPEAGDWTLIVSRKGSAPVVQPFKVKLGRTGDATSTPAPRTARAVSFQAEGKTKSAQGSRFALFTVTLFPFLELVFVSGTEVHDGGTQFRIFAENYGIALLRENKITDGVIMTLFSADNRARLAMVLASGETWMQVGIRRFGSTEGTKPGKSRTPNKATDFSITDVYKYISGVGASAPGRVLEVGIFAHAFPGGPILYNTFDTQKDQPARDPDDFDGRPKDFNATNTRQWPNLKKAMAPNGRWRIWGCSATTHHHDLVKAAQAQAKAGDDTPFTVKSRLTDDDGKLEELIENRTTRNRIRSEMHGRFSRRTYFAEAAIHLDVPVLGAPPGIGSSFGSPSKPKPGQRALSLMFVDVGDVAGNYAYFTAEFSPEFAPTNTSYDKGYVDYNRLRKRRAPAEPAFSADSFDLDQEFVVDESKGEVPRTTLRWRNGFSEQLDTPNTKLVRTDRSDLAETGKTAQLYELTDTKPPRAGIIRLVQSDRKVFRVTRDAKTGALTVVKPPLFR